MHKYLLTFFVSICIITVSCKKEKTDVIPSASEYLLGKWHFSHLIYDSNNDKLFDSSEISLNTDSATYIFSEGGTGYFSYIYSSPNITSSLQPIKWILSNDDKNMEIRFEDENYYYHSQHARIIKLNSTECILQIDSMPPGNANAQQLILKKIL